MTASPAELVEGYRRSPEFEQLAAAHPDVEVAVQLTPDRVTVAAAPEHLLRVFANLAINGFECQPDGGRLTLSTRIARCSERHVRHEAIEPGAYAVMSVRAAGTGIEPADAQRQFEPFFSKKTRGRSGTGLGLTIVWNTVHEHDGGVDVDSTPGEGTPIDLYLPLLDEDASTDRAEESPPRGAGETVLVVDDEAEQRHLATAALTGLGYRAEAVATAEAAIARGQQAPVDLSVLDVMLGTTMDGIEAFRTIRQLVPGARAILATGHTDEERSALARELGITTRLDKPYTIAALARAVRRGLDGSPVA